MRYSERFMEHIEYAFHAFCKIVLRHEAIDAWRDLKRKEEKEVIVDNEQLAIALSRLPKLGREVLLLYYFVGYRDEAIGKLYGRCRSPINHRRNVALKQLRKEWDRLEHEEQEADTF